MKESIVPESHFFLFQCCPLSAPLLSILFSSLTLVCFCSVPLSLKKGGAKRERGGLLKSIGPAQKRGPHPLNLSLEFCWA